MATITNTTTDTNGNTIIDISSSVDDSITLATAGTYSDKNIIFNLAVQTGAAEPVLQEKSVTPSTVMQEVTPDSGYDGLSKVSVDAIPTAEQATPSITVSSSGLITASTAQDDGYVAAGTKSATKQLTTQVAKTITPGTSNQTAVSAGRYTIGNVTVQGDANLVAENIKSGVNIFGVNGSYEGNNGIAEPVLQKKTVTYTSNGTATITPDAGYDGLSSVDVTVDVASGGGGSAGFKVTFPATAANWNLASYADLLLSDGTVKSFLSYSEVSGQTIENVVGIHCVGISSFYVLRMTLSEGSLAQYTVGSAESSTYRITTSNHTTKAFYNGGNRTFWWPLADTVISAIEMYNTD